MKCRAAVLHGINQAWSVEEIEIDPPKAGELLVQWKAAGLCHSDEHLVTGDMVPPAEVMAAMGSSLKEPLNALPRWPDVPKATRCAGFAGSGRRA